MEVVVADIFSNYIYVGKWNRILNINSISFWVRNIV